jgi:hypothetical protein
MSNNIFSEYISNEIVDFIDKNNQENLELEITLSTEKIPIQTYMNEISYISYCDDNIITCKYCKKKLHKKSIRIIKKCNHTYHKGCFEKLFKSKIKCNNTVDENTNFCLICNLD